MISLKRKLFIFNFVEIYFCESMPDIFQLKKNKVDFIKLIQSNFKFEESKIFYTLNIDLKKDIKTIWQNINKNYRYEIRRAENKDKIFENIICNPSQKDITFFIEFFNKFADLRSLRKANQKKLKILQNQKKIKIAYVFSDSNESNILSAHCYINDKKRIRLYHSASNISYKLKDKNLVARANKYLHWKAISKFKDIGYKTYDFGGISQIKKLNGIDKFKFQFHGDIITEYSGLLPVTLKGRFLIFIILLINKIK
tara:strand:- start:208 stop:972 length:765 start_codon:yes stop_codon:yes gene_type:complete